MLSFHFLHLWFIQRQLSTNVFKTLNNHILCHHIHGDGDTHEYHEEDDHGSTHPGGSLSVAAVVEVGSHVESILLDGTLVSGILVVTQSKQICELWSV